MALTTQELVAQFYGKGTFADQQESDPALTATTPTILLRNSPARFQYSISNNTTVVLSVSWLPSMTFAAGIQIPPGGTFSVNWLADLDTPARALWGLLGSGTGTVHVVEEFLVMGAPEPTT